MDELSALRPLLLATWKKQDGDWKSLGPRSTAKQAFDQLLHKWWQLGFDDLDRLTTKGLPGNGTKRPSMFLPPLDMDSAFVPVLFLPRTLEHFRNTDYKFYLALHRLNEFGTLDSIAFRFEGPHGQRDASLVGGTRHGRQRKQAPSPDDDDKAGPEPEEGTHEYRHAQVVSYIRGGPGLDGCPTWLPQQVPAFPLAANGPTAVYLCMLVGLYGLPFLKSVLGGEPETGKFLKRLQDLTTGGTRVRSVR